MPTPSVEEAHAQKSGNGSSSRTQRVASAEKVLEPLGYRAHWGKFPPPPGSVSPPMISRYPDADRWKAVRQRVDPHDIFLTSYWKQHLGL